jgi:hypothetical protein
MLREIGAEENAAGRGMLAALVVSTAGQRQPDMEFFELATQLRKNTSDIWRRWVNELKREFNCWSQARRKQKAGRLALLLRQGLCGGQRPNWVGCIRLAVLNQRFAE